jgi:hypothetical protein
VDFPVPIITLLVLFLLVGLLVCASIHLWVELWMFGSSFTSVMFDLGLDASEFFFRVSVHCTVCDVAGSCSAVDFEPGPSRYLFRFFVDFTACDVGGTEDFKFVPGPTGFFSVSCRRYYRNISRTLMWQLKWNKKILRHVAWC